MGAHAGRHRADGRLSDLARQIGGSPCPDCPDYGQQGGRSTGTASSCPTRRRASAAGVGHRRTGGEDMSSDSRTSSGLRARNAWNEHQKAMGGQGYSQAHIRAAYQSSPRASSSHSSSGLRARNAWNEHQKAMGGQGYSQAHIKAAYQSSPRASSSHSSSGLRARNAWNEHQKAMGGQGYSQAHISAAYQPLSLPGGHGLGMSAGSSSGGLNWNQFRSSMNRQGLSSAQMSQMYQDQK
ncbi:unnamed protein product [Effrenium voratum]|nr:unnamed protein product [Effrenium voratum]